MHQKETFFYQNLTYYEYSNYHDKKKLIFWAISSITTNASFKIVITNNISSILFDQNSLKHNKFINTMYKAYRFRLWKFIFLWIGSSYKKFIYGLLIINNWKYI